MEVVQRFLRVVSDFRVHNIHLILMERFRGVNPQRRPRVEQVTRTGARGCAPTTRECLESSMCSYRGRPLRQEATWVSESFGAAASARPATRETATRTWHRARLPSRT